MINLLRDARFGFRLLRKKPGFTVVAVVTLALGIAANTGIFSLVYATFLAPLPYRDSDKLVTVWSRIDGNRLLADAGDFTEWRRRATVFEDLNAWSTKSVNLATGDRPEHVQAAVAAAFLDRGLPLYAVENAFIVAAYRRIRHNAYSTPLPPTRSLHYFTGVIREVLDRPPGYREIEEMRQLLAHGD